MNYTKDTGWYYKNGNDKSPTWSGVEYLYKFLTQNKGIGPYAKEVKQEEVEIGDIAQISFDNIKFAHTLVIVKIENVKDLSKIFIASHTFDSFNRAISSYKLKKIRYIFKGLKDYKNDKFGKLI